MAKKHQNKKTFKEIKEEYQKKNAEILMSKAMAYNDIAKIAKNKTMCYKGKNQCLKQLMQKCPDMSSFVKDDIALSHKDILLVRLKTHWRGLHTHDKWLSMIA